MLCARSFLRVGVAAAVSTSTAAALSQGGAHAPVPLASTLRTARHPTTVFVHGLDSSKETWNGVIADLQSAGMPCVAVDLRGHGESPLGDESTFSQDALARDVVAAVEGCGVSRPWILVGHSMGGRVAMEVAAIAAEEDPGLLAAVVVEDMDAKPRAKWAPVAGAAYPAFDRSFASLDGAREALCAFYDPARVDGWIGCRVREDPDGTVWSDVNPRARALACERVLASTAGDAAWDRLAAAAPVPFAVHCWVAGPADTVCEWDGAGGVNDLAARFPAAEVREFPDAAHSIHNTDREAFVAGLLGVIDRATSAGASAASAPARAAARVEEGPS